MYTHTQHSMRSPTITTTRKTEKNDDERNESTETRCDSRRDRAKDSQRNISKGKFETEQIMNG